MKENFSTDDLKKWFKSHGITQREIARRLNITPGAVNALLNGKPFGAKTAHDWSIEFGLNEPWLLRREGPMLKPPTIEQSVSGNENQFTGIGDLHTGIPVAVHQQVLTQLDQSMQQNSRLIAIIENMQKINKK
ncbi:MAG: helix-turn-helix domain-containing protein [Bacteroidales bacterium]|nr:helix-turn-helix domain-containing protein [Bacteroidales bacterium]